jgi:type I restriction-modification system DNA methylase subunit
VSIEKNKYQKLENLWSDLFGNFFSYKDICVFLEVDTLAIENGEEFYINALESGVREAVFKVMKSPDDIKSIEANLGYSILPFVLGDSLLFDE